MGHVKQAIGDVSTIVGEIMTASEEQSRGIELVCRAVTGMDEMTQRNAALVEQAAAAAGALEEQATQLSACVAVFRVAIPARWDDSHLSDPESDVMLAPLGT